MIDTLREKAYQHIRRKIELREFPAGSRLEEVKLAKELGVSRVPVREAMCQLESEGILCQIPRLGMFVKVSSRDDICEWCELRAALEGYAAEKVAVEAMPQDLEKITEVHRRLLRLARLIRAENITDMKDPVWREWQQTDLDFHMAIVHATRNRAVVKLVSNLHIMDVFDMLVGLASNEPVHLMVARICKEHGSVLRAIRRHEPEVSRQAMVMQLKLSRQKLLDNYGGGQVRANYWDTITGAGVSETRDVSE